MTTYTADDFTNARFATHPDGRIAARIGRDLPWVMPCVENCESVGLECNGLDNAPSTFMSKEGWVPVRESKGNQARNEQKRIDHIQEQDRIIRRRNEQIAAQVEIIEEVRRDLDDYQAMHTRQIETIARLQENPRPLTADDGMLSRAVLEARKHKGTALALHSEVQAIVNAALTEPKPRPEGAEELSRLIATADVGEWDCGDLADALLATGRVRVTGAES